MKCSVLSSLFALLMLGNANAEALADASQSCSTQLTPAENLAMHHARARMIVTLGWQPLIAPIMIVSGDKKVASATRTTQPDG